MRIFWHLRGFFRAHWRRYVLAGVMLAGVALLNLLPPAILGRVVDGIAAGTLDARGVWQHAAALVAVALGVYVLRFLWRQILFSASYTLGRELRQRIHAHLTTLSPAALAAFPAGDLMARATNDVQAVEMSAGEAVLSVFDGLVTGLLVLGVMVFALSGTLTAMALAPWPLMSWAMWRLGVLLLARFDAAQAAFSRLNTVTQESVAGLRALRGLGAEAHAERLLADASVAATTANLEVSRIDARYDPIIYLTVGASFLISIGGGAWMIERGQLTIGQLTSFTLYLGQLVWPMFAFGWMANLVQRGSAAWARIDEFLRTPSAVPDGGTLEAVEGQRLEVAVREFAYPGRVQPALADLAFVLEPGCTLGVVGPTGSGKSTLLALLARFYETPQVSVRLGGRPLADYRLDALRAALALVMQEPVLFSATLRENLLLARPEAGEDDIARVLELAALGNDLAQWPAGLATEVGERGITLSGGQRQRLCLARALLGEARILLLDDALSAVDAETEHLILGALERHTRHLGRVIVSHRLSAVQAADEILVLRDGRVAERGTHAALLAADGWYAQTWRYQQLAAAVGGLA
ncbi:MAG: putative multidrug resistance ABC transporter ATP-binding/permease protein YheI [Pseudomonadales bacterium]|nr:putative multidrug resistance ABC transporter ATP-binding/permease protein YheI [Pseudomonadales bacterium]